MAYIPQPRVLSEDLIPSESLIVSKVSETFNLKQPPTATAVIPFKSPKLTMHTWIQLFNANGSAGIFRVIGETETLEKERQLNLKGAIDVLTDWRWKGESEFTGTTKTFIEKLLSFQEKPIWQLGECDDEKEYRKSGLAYAGLSDLFTELLNLKSDLYPTYDFSTTPWTLNIKKLPSEIGAELRMRRNLGNGVRIIRDDKNQCTRLYLTITKTNGAQETKVFDNIDAQNIFGVIEKTAEIEEKDVPNAEAYAEEYFAEYAAPYISISAPAIELFHQTGETWDELSVGKKCRVALPDYGETYTERVSSVTYSDVYGLPNAVTVNLANPIKPISEAMKEVSATSYAAMLSASSAEKDAKRIELIVKDIELALDETGINQLWKSGIILDAHEGVEIFSLYQGFSALYSGIKVNADAISLRVMKNGVIAAINLTSEEARIAASKIVLDGYVTASEFNATFADFFAQQAALIETTQLTAVNASAQTLSASGFTLANQRVQILGLSMGSIVSNAPVLTTNGAPINLSHSHAVTVSDDGTVTLGEAAEEGGNFKIADTKVYKDGVSAAYNRGYAAGSAAAGGSYDQGYTDGYSAGWIAAAAMATTSRNGNVIRVKRPSSIIDTPADDMTFTVGTGGSIDSIRNTAANTFFAQGVARAYITVNNGSAISVASATLTKTQTINVGQ